MDTQNETARNLLQQEPGQDSRHINANDETVSVTQVRPARHNHETANEYMRVVAVLNARWRVITCKDGIQWILQRRDACRSGQPRWKAVSYCRTRKALLRVSRTSCGHIDPDVLVTLHSLPLQIGGAA